MYNWDMQEVTVENDNSKMNYFLLHNGVYRPEKSTNKMRMGFNASCPTDNRLSLNDIQYKTEESSKMTYMLR
ncbi:hypothetical protein TNCV_898001 [Trichonephila clavipes]|nr:hypothetical protein TNCV_898001 [Trichonephila clavipes]